MRARWAAPIRKYWKISEQMMVKYLNMLPIIHAVGVKTWKWLDKHDGELVYKIIWKERGTERYIEDEYEIFDEHTGL